MLQACDGTNTAACQAIAREVYEAVLNWQRLDYTVELTGQPARILQAFHMFNLADYQSATAGIAMPSARAFVEALGIDPDGNAGLLLVGTLASIAAGKASAAKGVGKYEVGAYDALKSRSVAGDGLDIHHAMQKNPAGQAVGGYNPANGPSIAVPRGEHSRIPTIKGEYTGSARDLLAKDIRDLRNYTNAPNSSLRELIDLNKQMYPGAFGR